MRFIFGVLFIFVFPYLLYQAAMKWAIPYFAIAQHEFVAAIAIITIPAAISLVIGIFCASGARLPDN